MSTAPKGRSRLAIFARAGRRGEVKRRLAADIGDEAALGVHLELLQDTLTALAPGTGAFDPELWLAGEGALPPGAAALPQRQQPAGDLGTRMLAAFEDGVKVLVGSDVPTLTAAHVDDALARLARADLAFIPTEDGGYCLVAMHAPMPEIFRDIPWGTSSVMECTLARTGGRRVALTKALWDVDTVSDYHRWLSEVPRSEAPP
ncbi:MAG: TIGR04282 family arsenosugar biosynthesis glycosyltransferase [Gammaproteobacteria bacterium]|nr:TIGR04282 family arsenosugar biosynthesis glycosyltransferase [Gammaproteobacteria bacterium]